MAQLRSANARLVAEKVQVSTVVQKTITDLQCQMTAALMTAVEKKNSLEKQLEEAATTIFDLRAQLFEASHSRAPYISVPEKFQ
jgi:hypothetical protein